MGESQGGGKALYMSPCSLANAQRAFWKRGRGLDGRRKKRSDSWQVRKNHKAFERREEHCQITGEEGRKGELQQWSIGTLQHLHLTTDDIRLHTPHPLRRHQVRYWSEQGKGRVQGPPQAVSKVH